MRSKPHPKETKAKPKGMEPLGAEPKGMELNGTEPKGMEAKDAEPKVTEPWYSIVRWKAWLEAVGIVFAIGYAVVTYFQWRDSSKNFRFDEQAWIKAQPEVKSPLDLVVAGQTFNIPIKYENLGKSPARQIRAFVIVEKLGPGQSPRLDLAESGNTVETGIMFPNEPAHVFPAFLITPQAEYWVPTPDDVAEWKAGHIYFAVVISVDYLDYFNKAHTSNFCGAFQGYMKGTNTRACADFANVIDKD